MIKINIFALDYNPTLAAQMICDKHLPKMCLESTQLWATLALDSGIPARYKRTHSKHQCSVWMKLSSGNREWMREYTAELFREFELRRWKEHGSKGVFLDIVEKIFGDANKHLNIDDLIIKKPSDDALEWYKELGNQGIIKLQKVFDGWKLSFNGHKDFVEFYPAMPRECRVGRDAVEMYRNYYHTDKKDIVYWNWIPERGNWY